MSSAPSSKQRRCAAVVCRISAIYRRDRRQSAGACVPRQNLSNRVLERGDVINTEISVSYWGYSGQMHRPIFLQSEPGDLYKQLWDTTLEVVFAVRKSAARGRHERRCARCGRSYCGTRLHDQ